MKHPPSIRLAKLLSAINLIEPTHDILIEGISLDSRAVQPGFLFIALPGETVDGRCYIYDAIHRGAVAVIAEAMQFSPADYAVPIYLVDDLQQKIGVIAAQFYRKPSIQLPVYGVTGTNGKTSCTQFIAHALSALHRPCGIIGTLGFGFPGQLSNQGFTTPDAIRTQQLLAELQSQGAQAVAMEVSSHALAQGRVNAVAFHTAIFTNLTRDHLDYHGDMDSYANAKRRLFEFPDLRYAIINLDDGLGQQLAVELATRLAVVGYSVNSDINPLKNIEMVRVTHAEFHTMGMTAQIMTPWGKGELQSKLLGKFNLSNLLAVLATLGLQNIPLSIILQRLSQLQGVPGRVETFGGGSQPLVVVDYAHTPDALEQVLTALRLHCKGQLWCVFGCGGNRDRGKRSLMGYIAQQYADHIILTDDNPRHEQPQHIVTDIMQGITAIASVVVEHDRRRAIRHALACAKADDIVLIAGKGHETYQQIGDELVSFSDVAEVKILLNEI